MLDMSIPVGDVLFRNPLVSDHQVVLGVFLLGTPVEIERVRDDHPAIASAKAAETLAGIRRSR
jgi:hypothetical protein